MCDCEKAAVRVKNGLQLLQVGCEKACASLERVPADALSNSEQDTALLCTREMQQCWGSEYSLDLP